MHLVRVGLEGSSGQFAVAWVRIINGSAMRKAALLGRAAPWC